MPVRIPSKRLHGLRVLTQSEAVQFNYASITTPIDSVNESAVMASMGKSNAPDRGVWIKVGVDLYELAITRASIKGNLLDLTGDPDENPPTFQQDYCGKFVSDH